MKAYIEHESRGRLRVRMKQYRMTLEQADLLEAYLQNQPGVLNATVHERTCCAVIRYIGDRENIIRAIAQFNYTAPSVTALTPTHSGRALNREYQEKLVGKVITKFACTLFLPAPLQIARTIWLSLPFLGRGLKRLIHRELKVELLDALSIGVSMVRRDFSTAGSVMFLLDIGELLEEWTHKKSVEYGSRPMTQRCLYRCPTSLSVIAFWFAWAALSRWTVRLLKAKSWLIRRRLPENPCRLQSVRVRRFTPARSSRKATA